MSADELSAPAVGGELTLRPPILSRRSPEAAMKKIRRRLLTPTLAIPAMPMQRACYAPCGGSPYGQRYVVPRWGRPVVGPAVGPVGVGDGKSDPSEFLQLSAKATAPESNSSITNNKAKTQDLPEPSSNNGKKKMEPNTPYVIAKGDGPQGKTTAGFLCRYKKADELSIMCVCHGLSFSPAEFLRHAGNSHTSEPLRHIIVMPSPARASRR